MSGFKHDNVYQFVSTSDTMLLINDKKDLNNEKTFQRDNEIVERLAEFPHLFDRIP